MIIRHLLVTWCWLVAMPHQQTSTAEAKAVCEWMNSSLGKQDKTKQQIGKGYWTRNESTMIRYRGTTTATFHLFCQSERSKLQEQFISSSSTTTNYSHCFPPNHNLRQSLTPSSLFRAPPPFWTTDTYSWVTRVAAASAPVSAQFQVFTDPLLLLLLLLFAGTLFSTGGSHWHRHSEAT